MPTTYEIRNNQTTPVTLQDGDEVRVLAGVTLNTKSSGRPFGIVQNTVGSSRIFIDGTVEADEYAVQLDRSGQGQHDTIQIGVGGKVTSRYTAIKTSDISTVINAGEVEGGEKGLSSGLALKLTNTGLIYGSSVAIISSGKQEIANSGMIKSYTIGIIGSNEGDVILNTGHIEARSEALDLRDGNDLYDGSKGFIKGTVDLGEGNDTAYGGSANEWFYGQEGDDVVDGGAGNDRAEGGAGNDNLYGGSDNDDLVGGEGNDTLNGDDGHDYLEGDVGSDSLHGGAGKDRLNGGSDADHMAGGADSDSYYVDQVGDRVVETDAGGDADEVISTISYALVEHVEHLVASGKDALALTGNNQSNRISGNSASNILNGNAGNDTLNGGGGADKMTGGLGNDMYYVNDGSDRAIEASNGGTADSVITSISHTLASHIENLEGRGADAMDLSGNRLNNTIIGNSGINKIKANAGRDVLKGGLGNDVMTGGNGKDKFAFDTVLNSRSNVDRITDFKAKDDSILLENAIFRKLTKTGVLKGKNFVIGSQAKDSNDFVGYNSETGELWYDANGSGAGGKMTFAKIGIDKEISRLDFFVV